MFAVSRILFLLAVIVPLFALIPVGSNSGPRRQQQDKKKLQNDLELLLNYLNDADQPRSRTIKSQNGLKRRMPIAAFDEVEEGFVDGQEGKLEQSMEAVVVVPPFPNKKARKAKKVNMAQVRWHSGEEEDHNQSGETPRPVQVPLVGVGTIREVKMASHEEGRPKQPALGGRRSQRRDSESEETQKPRGSKQVVHPPASSTKATTIPLKVPSPAPAIVTKGAKFSKIGKASIGEPSNPSSSGDGPQLGSGTGEMNTVKKSGMVGGGSGGSGSGVIPPSSPKPPKQKGKPQSQNGPQQPGGGRGSKGPSSPKPMPSQPQPPMPSAPMPPPPPPSAPAPSPAVRPVTTTPNPSPKQNYKLIYFDARGICEPIRLLFHYSKVEFEDSRITRKQWLALKDSTVYGKVPILEVDGKPLTYCHTISRYLARTFDLAGKDNWEQAKVDEISDFHSDVAMDLQPYLYVVAGFHQGDKEGLRKAVFLPGVEKHFPVYVNILKQSGSGFFITSGLTWIDFVISEYMTTIKHFEPAILDKYPTITKFVRKVQALPQVFDYIANREHQPV